MKKTTVIATLCLLAVSLGVSADPAGVPEPLGILPPAAAPPSATAIDRSIKTRVVNPDPVIGSWRKRRAKLLLEDGLAALSRENLARALLAHAALREGRAERQLLAWSIIRSGHYDLTSAHIAALSAELTDWPADDIVKVAVERALYRQRAAPQSVIDAIGEREPRSFEGAVALTRAFLSINEEARARSVLGAFWRVKKLPAALEVAIIEEFGSLLTKADHRFRMERMLYEDRVRSAERVAKLADGVALTRAWAAVIRNRGEAGRLLEAVPEAERSAGYLFAKARYLRRQGKFDAAAEIMKNAPRDPQSLVDPDEWWVERRVLSREFLDLDKPQIAYEIAAAHSAQSPDRTADAEFHAGWYALRWLDDPVRAKKHFTRILEIAEGPISNARAHYWLGRAAEAAGEEETAVHYERAAAYSTSFYGQLAAGKLKRSILSVADPAASQVERERFNARPAVRAIALLKEADRRSESAILYRALAEELEAPGEIALLARMASDEGDHRLALRVGKAAAARGVDIGALAHPLGAIPAAASLPGTDKALAYAVARQETEFNAEAVSPVGAKGLLQLMPATAREMARKAGLAYSAVLLTSDAAYNVALGTTYLAEQLERSGGSYILTFIGYNAGPSRAREWVERYGDPRGKTLDEIVDWVERIPFTETRNYVQRVMENFQVYKARLGESFDITADMAAGG